MKIDYSGTVFSELSKVNVLVNIFIKERAITLVTILYCL